MANSPAIPYTCDDGSKFAAEFSANTEGRPLATLDLGGNTLVLPLVPAASGELYRADGISLHTRGDDALFDDGKTRMRRCSRGDTPPATAPRAAPAAPSSFVDISGSVAYLQRIALPPDAVLTVRVQDTSRADAKARTLAEQTIELGGQQVPISFHLVVDRDLLGKKARITVAARIERHGKLLFINDTAYPVKLNDGNGHVDMLLRQVAAPRKR